MKEKINMGEMTDFINQYDDERLEPEDYLNLTDDELKRITSGCRSKKLKGIRKWPNPLSDKQRYCLAAWIAEKENRYI
jgi:hypothetical protein